MKIILTENQFKVLIENIIKEESKEATKKQLEKGWRIENWFVSMIEDSSVIEDGEVKVWTNNENPLFHIDYSKENNMLRVSEWIWEFIEEGEEYSYNPKEIISLIRRMVGEHLNIWGFDLYVD
jgi:hypothetical protein